MIQRNIQFLSYGGFQYLLSNKIFHGRSHYALSHTQKRCSHFGTAKNNTEISLQKRRCNLNFGSNVETTFLRPFFAEQVTC